MACLREVELMNHVLRNLAKRTKFRIHQHIRLPIIRRTRLQELAYFCLRISFLEQGSMALAPHPLPDFIG